MQDKTSKNKELGDAGEAAAADYLKKQGFRIIARNVRFKQGELDIVAERKAELHFIEVRTRNNASFLSPIETITEQKRRRIRKAALLFLADARNGFKDRELPPCFFDVVGIDILNNKIECIFDAFV